MTRARTLVAVAVTSVVALVAWRAALGASDPAALLSGDHAVETLAELAARLDACGAEPGVRTHPCQHVVYLWSPSMPLSVAALPHIVEAAETLDVPLSVLPAEELPDELPPGSIEGVLAQELVSAGATVHYPSLVLFGDGEPLGNAVVGYKEAEGYVALLAPRLRGEGPGGGPAPLGPAPVGSGGGVAAEPARADVTVLWTKSLSPAPGAFFRRVPGTTFIAYEQSSDVILEDFVTGERLPGPGFIDFVPTPDGRLFVTPGPGNSGLEFYDVAEVFRQARSDTPRFRAAARDGEMADQYPSIGILSESADGSRVTYRILVSWFEGLAVRDYQVTWSDGGAPDVEALTPKTRACPGMGLSTPIMSKDGGEIAARDEATGTTKVFRLAQDGGCTELFDLGRQTSKVGFSDDGRLIAYSSPDADPRSSRGWQSVTYVLDRSDMETMEVPGSESFGLVIPEMVGPDSLLLAVRPVARSRTSEFKLLCCVRE